MKVVYRKECPWTLVVGKYKDRPRVQIRKFEDKHTCAKQVTNKFGNYQWIIEEYIELIRSSPKMHLLALVDQIMRGFNIKVYRSKVGRGKTLALDMQRGDKAEQFAKLANYGGVLKRTNPKTQLILGLDNLVFKQVFICLFGRKNGFPVGYRPIISLDGFFF